MVQAWYMDSSNEDQRMEHHRDPPEYVGLEDLYKLTGVEYFKVYIESGKILFFCVLSVSYI